jgi:hypothetical protein
MKVLSKMLKIIGGALIFVGIVGGILGSFDFVLVMRGIELPLLAPFGAIACVTIGLILFLLGHVLTKKFGDIDVIPTENPILNMGDLSFIVKSLKKTKRRNLMMGIFLSLFGLSMILLGLLSNEGKGVTIGLSIFGTICLLIGMFSFSQYAKLINIESSEIYQLIMFTPQKITGLTGQIFRSGFGKVGQAVNASIIVDKKTKCILSVSENDLELLRQYLLKHNPNLIFDKSTHQT